MIRKLTDNKSIAIIGNAQSLFDNNWSELINKYDVILRMNFGIYLNQEQIEKTTNRCDIYTENRNLTCLSNWDKYNKLQEPKLKVLTSPYASKKKDHLGIDWFLPNEYIHKYKKELNNFNPTTGYRNIRLFIDLDNFIELGIFGFDFFATHNFFSKDSKTNTHNLNLEKDKLLKFFEKDSRIKYYNMISREHK